MKARKLTLQLVLVSVVALRGLAFAAVDNDLSRKSLVGLRGVHVLVEHLKPEVERVGLTEAAIQTDAELRLRVAGIRVMTFDESVEVHGATLYLDAQVFHTEGPLWGYSTSVAVFQNVQLIRNPAIVVADATTWEVSFIGGAARPAHVPDNVRNLLKDLVDKFINAYLAANPK